MYGLPLMHEDDPETPLGIEQVLASANTDYVLPVPAGATGVGIAFCASTADDMLVWGRVGINQSGTTRDSVTATNLGQMFPTFMEIPLRTRQDRGRTIRPEDNHIHLACATAGAVVRGYWLFADDDGE